MKSTGLFFYKKRLNLLFLFMEFFFESGTLVEVKKRDRICNVSTLDVGRLCPSEPTEYGLVLNKTSSHCNIVRLYVDGETYDYHSRSFRAV